MVVDVAMDQLDRAHERIAGRFRRSEPRGRAREYVSGLVAGLERKNGWTLAEQAGEASPDGMQRLLRWADWDIDGVRDDVRDYVIEYLGEPAGVLIVDDTGFVKKGTRSADHVWAWSHWRRRRQHQARLSHYKRRGYPLTQLPLQY